MQITLMETDEFPDPKEGLPRGLFEYNGSDTPLGPQYAALREMINGADDDVARAAAAELAECFRASNIRSGRGLDSVYSEAEAEVMHPLPGARTANGMRLYTDEDGQINDEEALEQAEAAAAAAAAAKPLRGAAAASAKAKAEKDQREGEAAGAVSAAGGVASDMLPPGFHTPEEPPMQLKMEWVLINKGKL